MWYAWERRLEFPQCRGEQKSARAHARKSVWSVTPPKRETQMSKTQPEAMLSRAMMKGARLGLVSTAVWFGAAGS